MMVFPRSLSGSLRRDLAALLLPLPLVMTLTGCGGVASPVGSAIEAPGQVASAATTQQNTTPCSDSVLTVADLPAVDADASVAMSQLLTDAQAWQADAHLVKLSLFCMGSLTWDGVAYSPSVDEGYQIAEAQSIPYGSSSMAIDQAAVSFAHLHDWLTAAGLDDSATIPNGIDIASDFAPAGETAQAPWYRISVDDPDAPFVLIGPSGETAEPQA